MLNFNKGNETECVLFSTWYLHCGSLCFIVQITIMYACVCITVKMNALKCRTLATKMLL